MYPAIWAMLAPNTASKSTTDLFSVKRVAAPVPAPLLGDADVVEAVEGGAVPVGTEYPVAPAEKGPGGMEADAP